MISRKSVILFTTYRNGLHAQYEARGQVARTLYALCLQGDAGASALDVSCWAYRLASYVHILRSKYGLDIETRREAHDGGRHGRYILRSAVEINSLEPPLEA